MEKNVLLTKAIITHMFVEIVFNEFVWIRTLYKKDWRIEEIFPKFEVWKCSKIK